MCRILATASLAIASVGVRALDLGSTSALKDSAKSIAAGLVRLYPNESSGATVGLFDSFDTSYSWWEDGAVWSSFVDYWALTGDDQYNTLVQNAIYYQAGDGKNFLPLNEEDTEGNADQAIWALTALSAAEQKFPGNGDVDYMDLAKSGFEQLVRRWGDGTCGGGLRSEINSNDLPGYSYKDAFSTGTFFLLAARLAFITQNGTYSQWATKAYDWSVNIGLVNTQSYSVYQGTDASKNCSSVDQTQWSAGAAAFLCGSATLANVTYTQTGISQTQSFLTNLNSTFFQSSTITEQSCSSQCTLSQRAYKALAIRWLAGTGTMLEFATSQIQDLLSDNAVGITNGCSDGGASTCMINGQTGLGEQLSALNAVLALLVGRPPDATPSARGSASTAASGSGAATTSTDSASGSPFASKSRRSFVPVVMGYALPFLSVLV